MCIGRHGIIILEGFRDISKGLWHVSLTPTTKVLHQTNSNNMIELEKMRALPIISYSIQQTHSFHMDQINGRRKFCNTSQTHVRACLKNLPKLIATIKGHLNKHQMNPQSKNPREETPPPLNNSTNQRTNIVITKDFQLSG